MMLVPTKSRCPWTTQPLWGRAGGCMGLAGTGASCTCARGLCVSLCHSPGSVASVTGPALGSAPSPQDCPQCILLPSGNLLPLHCSRAVRLPSPWKSPGTLCAGCPVHGLCHLAGSAQSALSGGAESPSLGIPGYRVPCAVELGAGGADRSTEHFCSCCIAACMHKGQVGHCSYHSREWAGCCRQGPHHGVSRTGPYAAFHQPWPGPSLHIAHCLHTWLH